MYSNFKQELNFLIVPKIADIVPSETFPRNSFDIPKNLQLADPQFHVSKPVDILLAAGTTLSLLSIGQVKLDHQGVEIILQKTMLGWVVAGGADILNIPVQGSCHLIKLIERFWVIEGLDHEPLKSRDEISCEQHYVDNTTRDETGRYIVRLPFRDSKFQLGESRLQALRRFHSLEKKLEANPELKIAYHKVLNELV